ncbi:MAG: signal peptidase I [Minisyncoccia bacterium]
MNTDASTDHSPSAPAESQRSFAWYVTLALALALFVRFFVAAPYVVSGASMEPTFDNWDYLITDRISYDLSSPERGDVIVFCLPNSGECSPWKRILQGEWRGPRTLIKRVIGLPGETVSVEGTTVRITNTTHPDGFVLNEPYLSKDNLGGPTGTETTLGENEYFVLGDNRRVSSDSRVWGTLPEENIVGNVFVRLFPLHSIGTFPGGATYPAEAL